MTNRRRTLGLLSALVIVCAGALAGCKSGTQAAPPETPEMKQSRLDKKGD
jgi:hypothetical protein